MPEFTDITIPTLLIFMKILPLVFSIPLPENHLQTNKQLITNDVKNLTSILSCCIGPKGVSSNDDTKALSLCENHFSIIFTTRPLNYLRKNKQLTL